MTLDPSISFAAEAVSRRFPGVLAVKSVDLAVRKGEIHGLIGKKKSWDIVFSQFICGFINAFSSHKNRRNVFIRFFFEFNYFLGNFLNRSLVLRSQKANNASRFFFF